jgi:hypothetical protein
MRHLDQHRQLMAHHQRGACGSTPSRAAPPRTSRGFNAAAYSLEIPALHADAVHDGAALVDVAILRFHGIVHNVERDRARDAEPRSGVVNRRLRRSWSRGERCSRTVLLRPDGCVIYGATTPTHVIRTVHRVPRYRRFVAHAQPQQRGSFTAVKVLWQGQWYCASVASRDLAPAPRAVDINRCRG